MRLRVSLQWICLAVFGSSDDRPASIDRNGKPVETTWQRCQLNQITVLPLEGRIDEDFTAQKRIWIRTMRIGDGCIRPTRNRSPVAQVRFNTSATVNETIGTPKRSQVYELVHVVLCVCFFTAWLACRSKVCCRASGCLRGVDDDRITCASLRWRRPRISHRHSHVVGSDSGWRPFDNRNGEPLAYRGKRGKTLIKEFQSRHL